MHKFKQAFYTPKSCILAQSHAHLTVGEANLTVKMGCSHCEQCQEVERSAKGAGQAGRKRARGSTAEGKCVGNHTGLH